MLQLLVGCSVGRAHFESGGFKPPYPEIVVDTSAMPEGTVKLEDRSERSGFTDQRFTVYRDVLIVVKPLPSGYESR